MKIVIGAWFKLPRLGTAVFSALMREGVKYDRQTGFMLSPETDVESAVRTIGAATSEPVELSVRCYVCLNIACSGCPYFDACDRRKVSPMCLCGEHSGRKDVYETYQATFLSTLGE
jgi:hypothetical protein